MKDAFINTTLEKIPKNWNVSILGDISKIKMGQSPSSNSYNEDGNGLLLVQGNADIKNRKTTPRFWTSEPTKACDIGDIIMTVRAPVGAIAKAYHNACIGRGVCAISTKQIDREYLYQTLISYESSWSSLSQGSTFTAVNGNDIKNVSLLIPPLPEQQKIAEILSTVDEKIEAIDQRIVETQELKKGLMQQLLTKGIGHTQFKDSPLGEIPESWEVVELGTLLEKIVGGGTPSKEIPAYWNGNISWGTVKDLKSYIIEETIDSISEDGLKNSAATLIPAWTLVTSTRMALGKAVFFTKDVAINQDLKALYPKKELDKFFLFHWFFSNSEYILSLGSGSTVKGIRLEVLRGLKIALPNLSEQQKIAEILSSVDEKLQIQQDKKTEYQELKKGLMQQLLTGKIRVKI